MSRGKRAVCVAVLTIILSILPVSLPAARKHVSDTTPHAMVARAK